MVCGYVIWYDVMYMKYKSIFLVLLPIVFAVVTMLLYHMIGENLHDDILGNTIGIVSFFLFVSGLHVLYFFWILYLRIIKSVKTVHVVISIPTIVLYIGFGFLGHIIIAGRGRVLDLGPDPFVPKTTITSHQQVPFWSIDFWVTDEMYIKRNREKKIADMQKARQGSLIGHVGTDLQGWSRERVLYAFGSPSKITPMGGGLEKWVYHPWTNHPDWEMPVYLQDDVLLKIGD